MNPATNKNKQPSHLLAYRFLPVILILQAAVFLTLDWPAQSEDSGKAAPPNWAAIPNKPPDRPGSRQALGKGKFLVADRQLVDPNFRETVVLLIDYGLDGAMGLVINRPSSVKLATVFPDIKELEGRADTIYVGGPVAINQILLLVRSERTPEQAELVTDNVYISPSWKMLERLIKKPDKDERFRLFAGYAGWAPDQLDFERSRGDWHVLEAEAEMIFSQNPDELWPELIQRAEVNWVRRQGGNDTVGMKILPDRSIIQAFKSY